MMSASFTFSPTVPTSHKRFQPKTMHPIPYSSLVLNTFWCLTSNSILQSSPKALFKTLLTSFLNSLLEPGTLVSLTQQVMTTFSGLPNSVIFIGWMVYSLLTRITACPFPTGQYPGLTSRIYSWIPILLRRGMRPSRMLSRGGDLLTSVPPLILICSVWPSPVQTGTKHCIMSVQLAAVPASISLGCKNLGQKQTSLSPTFGTFSTKALKMDLSWLFMPGFGLFFLMPTILNSLLSRRLSARELLIIWPPPSCRLPSIQTISSIFFIIQSKNKIIQNTPSGHFCRNFLPPPEPVFRSRKGIQISES